MYVCCILLQYSMLSRTLVQLTQEMAGGSFAFSGHVSSVLFQHLLITLGLLTPLTISVGILVTFRIAGPIYRFETYLQSVARGENPGPCRLRKGDELQDLCDAINEALNALRSESQLESADPPQSEPVEMSP